MIQLRSSSTLFPYTTLFRSLALHDLATLLAQQRLRHAPQPLHLLGVTESLLREHRTEEHTSELQSRRDVVCRLLPDIKTKSHLRVLNYSYKYYNKNQLLDHL